MIRVNEATRTGTIAPADVGDEPMGERAGPALPPPLGFDAACAGDVGELIAILIAKGAQEQRKAARDTKRALDAASEAAERRAVDALEEKAEAAFESGVLGGGLTMAAGAGSFAGIGESALHAGSKCDKLAEAGSSVLVGGEKLSTATGKQIETEYDADRADADAVAGRMRRAAEKAREDDADGKRLLEKALEFAKELANARAQAMTAALQRA